MQPDEGNFTTDEAWIEFLQDLELCDADEVLRDALVAERRRALRSREGVLDV
ncbi:MAG: hypothetical protein KJN71_03405 [Acidimicrobiia bacterium]|nr:hypothetical protein [Acidimicrobiia bacterium]